MSTTLLPTTERALLRRLALEQREGRVPSLIAGLVRDGETIWVDTRGWVDGEPATSDTQYRIGSITKTFVAVLVMRLRDEGRLELTDRIDDHVPGTAVGDRPVWQLLAHNSGLSSESPGQWWERTPGVDAERFVAALDDSQVRPHPQHVFHYSNSGFGLLGELVARHRGADWFEVLRDEILTPLGMHRTTTSPIAPRPRGWAVHPWADLVQEEPAEDAGAMAPAGQLWSTVDDMARWSRFLSGETGEVLHPDTLVEMRTPTSVDDADAWTAGIGLGLQLSRYRGRRLVGHGGSMPGFLSTVLADPAERTGVVFLANTTAGPGAGLATDLLDILEEHEPRIPEPWQPSGADPALLELTGAWYWGPVAHVMRVLPDGMLDLAPWRGKGRASRFRPNGDGTWTGLDGYHRGELLRVGRDSEGRPNHLDLNTFVFTRTPYDPDAPVPGGVESWR
ncbi:CubicO group peptidase (beta-lactamase class C family) [Saccharopolyspora lacisalsi]|uniref:CubicO group peptidase (Beta-lactamase class C family) n=1 Tax=Halosaccharopolyspora lacisalsi TaxID=1000566 RepID=A0A839DWL4_9PSEU|nr:serine hydrolase domain-containing protein [Halosaccharopolyspora lacisalsi]MBA8825149.1 CubicO group peptidase (beta-lactamase class C family) [Halosaccharopolyspora lacisalsi]